MDDIERANRLVALFVQHRAQLEMDEDRRIKDNEYALDYLHVKADSFNQWFNRKRLPRDFMNIVCLAEVLGDEIYTIFGYEAGDFVKEPRARRYYKAWRMANEEDRDKIEKLMEPEIEKIEKKYKRINRRTLATNS